MSPERVFLFPQFVCWSGLFWNGRRRTLQRILKFKRSGLLLAMLAVLAVLALTGGCSSRKVVSRVDVDEQIDLSGHWNDTDSRLVANDLITQAMSSPWIENHLIDAGERPAVIVGPIKNKTPEHIPVKTFIADLERALINSGRVKMVASAEEREALRDERADQQEYSSPESINRFGRELGADYMLLGEMNSIFDREEGDEVKYYQVDCYLVNLEDNTKVWTGFKKIKKFVGRSEYKP
jgi:uncharacterized protein (TIGR02722 family)